MPDPIFKNSLFMNLVSIVMQCYFFFSFFPSNVGMSDPEKENQTKSYVLWELGSLTDFAGEKILYCSYVVFKCMFEEAFCVIVL